MLQERVLLMAETRLPLDVCALAFYARQVCLCHLLRCSCAPGLLL